MILKADSPIRCFLRRKKICNWILSFWLMVDSNQTVCSPNHCFVMKKRIDSWNPNYGW